MVSRLPSSWTSSTAWWCQVPAVSMATEFDTLKLLTFRFQIGIWFNLWQFWGMYSMGWKMSEWGFNVPPDTHSRSFLVDEVTVHTTYVCWYCCAGICFLGFFYLMHFSMSLCSNLLISLRICCTTHWKCSCSCSYWCQHLKAAGFPRIQSVLPGLLLHVTVLMYCVAVKFLLVCLKYGVAWCSVENELKVVGSSRSRLGHWRDALICNVVSR